MSTKSLQATGSRIGGLRANALAGLIMLLTEYSLGIFVNLYSTLPAVDSQDAVRRTRCRGRQWSAARDPARTAWNPSGDHRHPRSLTGHKTRQTATDRAQRHLAPRNLRRLAVKDPHSSGIQRLPRRWQWHSLRR